MSATDVTPGRVPESELRRATFMRGYVPGNELVIDSSVRLHQSADDDLDPISYEVIRSKLWNLNLDHGETVRRTSGSFPVADSNDFNATITTEIGEGAAFGPYTWFFAGYADLSIKWTLEHRAANPGIHDGDVFIHNDPWVGTNHQNDVAVFAPVFWGDELFAWVYNCAHHSDRGGVVPGSLNPAALSVYDEASLFPPVPIVERGILRDDILDIWTRQSRGPAISSLEVKSQLAGVNMARRRLLEIIERYSDRTVKGAMYKMLDDSSRIVGERLARLPDALWRDERYVAGVSPGDTRPYKLCLSYEKRGDRLRVSNQGTDPAVGMLNFTVGALRGSVVTGLFHALAFDLDMCGGGLLRQVDFDIQPGTINAASHPSSVGSSIGTIASCAQAQVLAAKLVSGDPELARHGFATNGLHTLTAIGAWGTDQYGGTYQNSILDTIAAGGGAYPDRDGLDHCGSAVGVSSPIPDVETIERGMPVLCLYRREVPEAGGHGRHRGGATTLSAWIGEGSTDSWMVIGGLCPSVTMGRGLDGAPVSTAGRNLYAPDSSVRDHLGRGRVPADPGALREAAPALQRASKEPRPFTRDSVCELLASSGAGYGDPLERDEAAVDADIRTGRVTVAEAERVFGVAMGPSGVDAEATRRRRATLVHARLAAARAPRHPVDGTSAAVEGATQPLASVHLSEGDEFLICARCGQRLSEAAGNYRMGCREGEVRLPEVSELLEDPIEEVGEPIVLRQYLCPGCGVCLDAELCRPDDVPYRDLEVFTPSEVGSPP